MYLRNYAHVETEAKLRIDILKYILSLVVSILAGAMTYFIVSSYFSENHRVKIQNRGYNFVSDFSQDLRSVAFVPRSLAAYVGIHPDIDQRGFENFALSVRDSVDSNIEIFAMQLAPGGVVTYEQPYSGGPHIGHDLLEDETRKQAVIEAIKLNATITDGPVDLIQGGSALIIRHPVTVSDLQSDGIVDFWGLATILVDWSRLRDQLIEYEKLHNTSLTLVKTSSYSPVEAIIYGKPLYRDPIAIGHIDLYGVTYNVYENSRTGRFFESIFISFCVGGFLGVIWYLLLKNIELKKLSRIEAHDYYNRIYEVIMSIAKARDDGTANHQVRTAKMAYLILSSYEAKLGERKIELSEDAFCKAISLHDIGKVAVPDRILNKFGPLDAKEKAEMQKHCANGAGLLRSLRESSVYLRDDPMLVEAEIIAMQHHENWDGSGYPSGIKGEEISLSARIMSIVDVYDALRSKRTYKDDFDSQLALEKMKEVSDQKFDPQLFEVFLSLERDLAGIFDHYSNCPSSEVLGQMEA